MYRAKILTPYKTNSDLSNHTYSNPFSTKGWNVNSVRPEIHLGNTISLTTKMLADSTQ